MFTEHMSRLIPAIRPPATPELAALIVGTGKPGVRRFLEFFTTNIPSRNTRAAYARAAGDFPRWCDGQGADTLGRVQPVHIAAYIERLQGERPAPTAKQHLACLRMLFDWLVAGQAIPTSPAHSILGPRHSVSKGTTPVLFPEEATAAPTSMDVSTVVGLRDRVAIAVMTYTFSRVGAVVAPGVGDYFPQKKRWWPRLHERNDNVNEAPCHHKLEEYLDAYIEVAGLRRRHKGPLFRSAIGKSGALTAKRMSRTDVWYMIRRRAPDAGIETPIGCHTFRATGITDYLRNGGRVEVAQRMAGHSNAKTTGLYDRRNDDISVGEVERIGI